MSRPTFPGYRKLALLLSACGLAACGREGSPAAAPATQKDAEVTAAHLDTVAGIQDIMAYMIDPAADALWESVSSTVTPSGVIDKQPHSPEEWDAVRRQAIILTEGATLISMPGRHVAREGGKLEDQDTRGNLTAAQSGQAIANDRGAFLAFANALHDVGRSMLKASDARDPQGLVDAGDTLDRVCEGCHLKFWYPGQKIPLFPDQAPELDH